MSGVAIREYYPNWYIAHLKAELASLKTKKNQTFHNAAYSEGLATFIQGLNQQKELNKDMMYLYGAAALRKAPGRSILKPAVKNGNNYYYNAHEKTPIPRKRITFHPNIRNKPMNQRKNSGQGRKKGFSKTELQEYQKMLSNVSKAGVERRLKRYQEALLRFPERNHRIMPPIESYFTRRGPIRATAMTNNQVREWIQEMRKGEHLPHFNGYIQHPQRTL